MTFIPNVLKSGLQKESLKGQVKSMQIVTFEGKKNHKEEEFGMVIYPGYNYIILFDTNGNIVKNVSLTADLTLKDYKTVTSSEIFIHSNTVSVYDKENRIVSELITNNYLGQEASTEEIKYKYDFSKDKDTLMITKDNKEKMILAFNKDTLLSYEKINLSKSSGTRSAEVWAYKYFTDSIVETYTSYYDLEKTNISHKNLNTYNKYGLLIQRISFYYRNGENKIEYTNTYYYDKRDNLIEVKSSIDSYSQKIKYKKKDKHRNWLIMENISPSTVQIAQRKIFYY